MRRLLESQALQGSPLAQSNLAFVDSSVPGQDAVLSCRLPQPDPALGMAPCCSRPQLLPCVDSTRHPAGVNSRRAWQTLRLLHENTMALPPPPGVDMQRPLRRQRRGCRGGKGRKRHTHQTMSHELVTERSGSLTMYSPRIMSAAYGSAAATLPYPQPSSRLAGWPSRPAPASAMSAPLPPHVHTGYFPGLRV